MFFFKKKENIEKSGEISKNDKQTNDNKSGKAKEWFFVRLNQFHLSLSNWYTLTCLRWDSTISKISFSKLYMLINIPF